MKKRLVIHVGSPKTGTTSIQDYFFHNRVMFHEKHKLLYPVIGTSGRLKGHHNLVYEVTKSPKFDVANGDFRALFGIFADDSVSRVLISAEGFLRIPSAVKRALAAGPAVDVEIVFYLRRQDRYLETAYNQLARMGRVDEHPEAFLARRKDLLAYRGLVESWESSFPGAKISVIPFETEVIGGDVTKDMSERVLGIPFSPTPNLVRRNSRAGLKAIRGVYVVRDACRQRLGPETNIDVPTVNRVKKIFETDEIYQYGFVSAQLSSEVRQQYRGDNEWLAARFPGFAEQTFFALTAEPSKGAHVRLFEPGHLSAFELDALSEVVDWVCKRSSARKAG